MSLDGVSNIGRLSVKISFSAINLLQAPKLGYISEVRNSV